MNKTDRQLNRLFNLAREAPPFPPGRPAPPFVPRRIVRHCLTETRDPIPTRRVGKVLVLASLAFLMTAGIFIVVRDPGATQQSMAVTRPAPGELKELAWLVAEPPVVRLDESRAAWLSVLSEVSEGGVQ